MEKSNIQLQVIFYLQKRILIVSNFSIKCCSSASVNVVSLELLLTPSFTDDPNYLFQIEFDYENVWIEEAHSWDSVLFTIWPDD